METPTDPQVAAHHTVYAATFAVQPEGERARLLARICVDGSVWADVDGLRELLARWRPTNPFDAANYHEIRFLLLAIETGKVPMVSEQLAEAVARATAEKYPEKLHPLLEEPTT